VPARSIGRPLDGPRRPGGGPPWPWLARAPAENSCPDLVAGNSEGLSPFTLWPDQAIREPHGCRTGTGSRSPSLEFSNINRCGRLWAASRPRPARLCAAPDPSPARAGTEAGNPHLGTKKAGVSARKIAKESGRDGPSCVTGFDAGRLSAGLVGNARRRFYLNLLRSCCARCRWPRLHCVAGNGGRLPLADLVGGKPPNAAAR
jgi:hypothetical protein